MKTAIYFIFCALMTGAVAVVSEPAASQAAVPADHNTLCKVIGCISFVVLLYCLFVLFLGGCFRMNKRPEVCCECDQGPVLTNPDDLIEKRDRMKASLEEYFKSQATVRGTDESHKLDERGATPRPATNHKPMTPEEHNRFPNGRWS